MFTTKIYTEKTFYITKYGEREYLNGTKSDKTLIEAAMLTGKGLNTEEECIYTSYGETEQESEKAMDNYIKAMTDLPMITRRETISSF